jgi:hypothetical protein
MPPVTPAELAAAVSATSLFKTLEGLACHVKLAGTAEELTSLRGIEAQLAGLGYRTTLLHHPAYISLPGAAAVLVDGQSQRCITHSFSRPTPPGGLTAPVVDLGKGTPADFAAHDLTGCIALIEGMATPAMAARANEAGTLAQLHISPDAHLHEMCISPVWGSPDERSRADLPRCVALTMGRQSGLALRARLAAGEAPSVTLHAEVDTGWRETPILVAEMDAPGAGTDAPFVMFSGHHDTWHLGVMDNGAANATMVEVARLCALHRDAWRRGLRLCFWSGHSQGRYSGSTWYADAFWDELDRRCVVHVNTDSTGGRGADIVNQSGASAELWALAGEAVAQEAGQTYARVRHGRNGDESFWGIGIPSIFNSLGHHPAPPGADGEGHMKLGWWWHTPDDTLDKIDADTLVRDTRVFVHVVWRLLTDRKLPFDYAEHGRALQAELARLQASLGDALDLTLLAERCEALTQAATAQLARAADADEAALARINAALMRAGRALVPMDYTQGDRFQPDPALEQPAWPSLQPLRRLASARGTEEAPFLAVSAMRARNRLAHVLRQAIEALES